MLRAYLHILGQERPLTLPPDVVTAMHRELELLQTFAADLRAAPTVPHGELTVWLAPVALDGLLARAVTFAQTLPGGHTLHAPELTRCRVFADADRIDQVLHNLLSNAAK